MEKPTLEHFVETEIPKLTHPKEFDSKHVLEQKVQANCCEFKQRKLLV